MSLEDKIKATAKNIEGKVQEAVGEITGDPEQKMEGKRKQAEAEIQHGIENLKDKAKKLID
ncbi:CsbD family protein [Capilliphycus salinus ALCB114379]|uniref:CsbD family protein n=1 Tax=Capilliphycus salinus TaxID=2768948 RepID=UPI0039A77D93